MKARTGDRWRIFARLLTRAALVRRGRAMTALLAVVVAASVATAMLNLYVDVEAKLRKEFRNYGANITVLAKEGQALPADATARVENILGVRGLAVPFAYVVAKTGDGSPVVVAGTDLQRVRKLNNWWSVTAWPSASHAALLGVRAAPVVTPAGDPFTLSFQGHSITLTPAGKLHTGAAEDSRVYLSLADFEAWTGVKPSSIEIAAAGTATEIAAVVSRLESQLPDAEVRPVRQIMEAEANVLGKTRAALLAAAALIIITAAMCVLSTLTTWVLDQRKNFAVMKALGASERMVNGFFAAEAAAIGALGAVIGYLIGIGVAAWIGRVNFHAAVTPRLSVLPVVLTGSVAVAMLSAVLPISLLRRIQPAVILRGE
jgi:putative ABC transport system permease protein